MWRRFTLPDTPPPDIERVIELRDNVTAFWRRLRSERADHLITPSQLQALGHLRRHGAMSATRLAHHEQVTPQSIARTIAILQDAGLVTRTPDPHDARAYLIEITEAGQRLLAEDRERRAGLLTELIHAECTAHERDILFVAGRIMGELAEAPRHTLGER